MTYEEARRCMVVCRELGVVVGWEGCSAESHSFWVSLDTGATQLVHDNCVIFSDYDAFMNWAEAYELTTPGPRRVHDT